MLVRGLQLLPRHIARAFGAALGGLLHLSLRRLVHVGETNLRIALPEKPRQDRDLLLRRMFRNLGWLLAEFCKMPTYTPADARSIMRYEGLEHYTAAVERGKGILVLTGHLGAWELSSFLHSLLGSPMGLVIRRLDNPLVDRLVNRIRCMHGNRVLDKDDFARELLRAMAAGEAVGILMDTNMTPPQGDFVPFFGRAACTATGLARIARRTGAAVVPGFLLWNEEEGRYVLHFGEALVVANTPDAEADALENTARFAAVTESYIRRYPDQWLWVHRRWKTRPPGQPPIY